MDIRAFPAGDLIQRGIDDLKHGILSRPSLLVSIARDRFAFCGIPLPPPLADDPSQALYDLIAEIEGDGAHSAYNALLRQLDSFLAAYERHLYP